MDTTLIQENFRLKDELEAAYKYITELEEIKKKYTKYVDEQIKIMSEHIPDGPAKDDFIKVLLKLY